MKRNASVIAMSLCLILLLASSVLAGPKKGRATVEIINDSSWDIYQLYISPSHTDEWGPDQLADAILAAGESLLIYDILCNDYDLMFVDEDGDRCIIEEETLCVDDSVWHITDEGLISCEWSTN